MIATNALLACLLIDAAVYEAALITIPTLLVEIIIWRNIYYRRRSSKNISKKSILIVSIVCAGLTSILLIFDLPYYTFMVLLVVRDFWALSRSSALPAQPRMFANVAGSLFVLEYLPPRLGVIVLSISLLVSSVILSSLEVIYVFSIPALNRFAGFGFVLSLISFWCCVLLGFVVSNLIHGAD